MYYFLLAVSPLIFLCPSLVALRNNFVFKESQNKPSSRSDCFHSRAYDVFARTISDSKPACQKQSFYTVPRPCFNESSSIQLYSLYDDRFEAYNVNSFGNGSSLETLTSLRDIFRMDFFVSPRRENR